MKTRRGFTTLELLITMSMLLVMTSMAVISGEKLRHRSEVRGSADRYRAKHAVARAVAVRLGRTTRLQVDTAGGRVWIEVHRSATVRDTVGAVEYFDPVLRFQSNRTVLCFDARGLGKSGGACESPDATVVFRMGARADTVRTSVIGRVIR